MPAVELDAPEQSPAPTVPPSARPSGPPAPSSGIGAPRPRANLLPFAGVAALFVLVVITLQLSGRLRHSLEGELAGRLRISADLAGEAMRSPDGEPFGTSDDELVARLDRIRHSTAVSDIVLYDKGGDLVTGATTRAQLGMAVPRSVRVGAGHGNGTADPSLRQPERDVTGGLTLLVPLSESAGGGAVLTRIDPESQGGLPAIDFLFQLAKALAGIVTAAGLLILLRWATGNGGFVPRPSGAVPGSDVGMVLGTVKEVMSTLKDSETTYRDRWTAAEADAEAQRQRSDQIVASIESGLVAFDKAGRVTLFNRSAERLLGLPARGALGRRIGELFDEQDPVHRIANEILQDLHVHVRTEWERAQVEGEAAWLSASSSVVRDRRGIPQGGMLLIDDVTETKRLREAAGLNDRLLAVGEMSAGMAHEIKNSLHSLMGHANLLREDHPGEDPLAVRGILSEVQSLQALVMGILEFSKPTRLVREPHDLNDLLTEGLESVRTRAESAGVTLDYELADDLPSVRVDYPSLRHAFLNCAHNAIEAMEGQGGGTLTVITRTAEIREDAEPGGESRSRSAVRVSFRDTGPGIAESDRQRIFTPFYSTKRDGHGLGLALVHRTVTAHGGRVQLHSRPGVGTEFVMLIPSEAVE